MSFLIQKYRQQKYEVVLKGATADVLVMLIAQRLDELKNVPEERIQLSIEAELYNILADRVNNRAKTIKLNLFHHQAAALNRLCQQRTFEVDHFYQLLLEQLGGELGSKI
jgi:hypothetical protein